nr:hypothetical protein [Tanacetum cinerariifolium]
KNLEEHCDHLAQVLQVIKDNTLYAKRTKIYFAVPQVEYLDHIISAQVERVPWSNRILYASISQPLVALTKKDAFKWNPSTELAYHKLKEAMVKALVLALPNFEEEFVVETDASGKGIGAVLCQNGHPIAYWSKTLSAKHQAPSTYEKEFLAVVAALDKWKGYLLDRHFKIRTYHFSLKYNYEIVYKKGSENVVADALSRMDSSGELLQIYVSSVSGGVWDKVKDSWKNDLDTQNLIKSLKHHSYKGNKYSWTNGILKRKGKVVVRNDPELRRELVQHFYDEAIGGHSSAHALFAELKVKLKISTAYHPQTDGQTSVVNRSLGCYLRGMCGEKPEEWEVDRTLQAREEAIKVLKFHLKRSQDRMRNQANKHRTDKQFKVDEWVYLKLQPHRQVSIRQGQQHKLSPKYYGPFKVAEKIGEVAYRLELPSSSQIHPVFYISQLKKCHGKDHNVGVLPQLSEDGLLENQPMEILEKRLGKLFLEDKESLRRMELIQAKSEVNTVGLEVGTANRKFCYVVGAREVHVLFSPTSKQI